MAEEDPSKSSHGRYPHAPSPSFFTFIYTPLDAAHADNVTLTGSVQCQCMGLQLVCFRV